MKLSMIILWLLFLTVAEISYNLEYQSPSKKKEEVKSSENEDSSEDSDGGSKMVMPQFDRSTKPISNKPPIVQKAKEYDDDEMEDVLKTFHQIKLNNDTKRASQTTTNTQETKKKPVVFAPAINRSLKPTSNNIKPTNEVTCNGFSNNTKLISTNKKIAFDEDNDDSLEKLMLENNNEMNGKTTKKVEGNRETKMKIKSVDTKNRFLFKDYSDDEDDSGDERDIYYDRKRGAEQNAKQNFFKKV